MDDRLCPFCNDAIESELHVLIECATYNAVRHDLFSKMCVDTNGFMCFTKAEMLKIILNNSDEYIVKCCARACYNILSIRRKMLYR